MVSSIILFDFVDLSGARIGFWHVWRRPNDESNCHVSGSRCNTWRPCDWTAGKTGLKTGLTSKEIGVSYWWELSRGIVQPANETHQFCPTARAVHCWTGHVILPEQSQYGQKEISIPQNRLVSFAGWSIPRDSSVRAGLWHQHSCTLTRIPSCLWIFWIRIIALSFKYTGWYLPQRT